MKQASFIALLGCLLSISQILPAQISPLEGTGRDFNRTVGPPPIDALFQETVVPSQFIPVDAGRGAVFTGDGGTKIVVPPSAFIDEEGQEVLGEVMVEFKEVVDKSDILLSNVPTTANGLPLVSGGVIYLDAKAGGMPVSIAPSKSISATFAKGDRSEGMRGFEGAYDRKKQMGWTPMESPLTADPKTLLFKDGRHQVKAYLLSMVYESAVCQGKDKVKIDLEYDIATGVTNRVRVIGINACFNKVIPEILQHIVWKGDGDGKLAMTVYFDEVTFAGVGKGQKALPQPDVAFQLYDTKYEDAEDVAVIDVMAGSTVEVTNLGWVNWDKYLETPLSSDFLVRISGGKEKELARVFVVYDDVNCVLGAVQAGADQYQFKEVPSGIPAKIIAMSYSKGRPFWGVVEIASLGEDIKLKLKPTTVEALKAEAGQLLN